MIYSQPWKVLLNNRVRFFKLKNWPTFILEVNIMRYIICSDLLHHENYIHISLILQFIRYLVMSGSFGTNFIHNCVSCASIISVNNNNKGQGYKWIMGNTFCYHKKHSTTAILPHDWLNQKCTPTLHQKHARKKMPPALSLLQMLMFFWTEGCTIFLQLQPFFYNHELEPEMECERFSTSRNIFINIC